MVFSYGNAGSGENLLFPVFRGWTTEQREGVSYNVPVTADQPLLYSAFSGHLQQFSGIVASEQRNTSLPQNLFQKNIPASAFRS
ncbi:Uncharacterised protein [Escherichia coli]|nr:Uncharacterised protein [Escherichia coli]